MIAEAPAPLPARSLSGRPWLLRAADDRVAVAHAQGLGIPDILGRVLAARGIAADAGPAFLRPTLRTWLPDPSLVPDMDRAAARLADAVTRGEGVAAFGDYDVDGATSAALMVRAFRALGVHVPAVIPDRQRDGYGPNGRALRRLAAEGARVVVTLDCGTLAHQALAEGREAGLDIIVCDHHLPGPMLPAVTAVVNPNRVDDRSGAGQLAAVGVAFLMMVAVQRELRRRGWFGPDRPEPDLLPLLDLVALGTVCDVVPLTGVNRALVTQGLAMLNRWGNPGLAALREASRAGAVADAQTLGFLLGPRINAGGRVGRSDLGVRLLATDDAEEARAIAAELNGLNGVRQELEADVLAQAVARAEREGLRPGLVWACDPGFHAGVVGIVAGRLKERFGRPALVFAEADGLARASGRSIPGVDLGGAVLGAVAEGLALSGGGHAMAAGVTVPREGLERFVTALEARLAPQVAAAADARRVLLDAEIACAAATPALGAALAQAGPYGAGHPEPLLMVPDVLIVHADVAGRDHVRGIAAGSDGGRVPFIAFRAAGEAWGGALLARRGRFHLAGRLQRNDWNGQERVQLVLEDAAQ